MPLYKFVGNRILTRSRTSSPGSTSPSGTAATAPTASTRSPTSTSRRTPTTSTSTPRSSSACTPPGSGSSRSRSRPTTATRSATSTAWRTPSDVAKDVVRFRARRMGFGDGGRGGRRRRLRAQAVTALLARRPAPLARLARARQGARRGLLRRSVRRVCRDQGHHVTGVDLVKLPGVAQRLRLLPTTPTSTPASRRTWRASSMSSSPGTSSST